MMFRKLTSFHDYFVGLLMPMDLYSAHRDEFNQAQTYLRVYIAVTPLLLFFAISYHFMQSYHVELFCWISFFLSLASYFAFRQTRSVTFASHIMAAGSYAVLVFGSFYAGGIHAPGVIWFANAQLLSALVFSQRWIFFWTLMYAAGALILGFSHKLGLNFPVEFPPDELQLIKVLSTISAGLVMFFATVLINNFRNESKTAIEQKNDELSEALSQNLALIRLLSHDVTNSLFVLQASTQHIQKGIGPTDKSLERIQLATENILNLVNHVKERQALLSGKKEIPLKPVDILHSIQSALSVLKEKIEEKNIQIELQTNHFQNTLILAEPTSLVNVVIGNFLSNAIKFSTIGARIQIQLKNIGNSVELTIQDQGIGIPEDMLKNLFNFEAKTSRTGTQGEKGTGFGMPLAKTYVDIFGGQLQITSSCISKNPSQHGTTVTIKFQTAKTHALAA